MKIPTSDDLRTAVRADYGKVAEAPEPSCDCLPAACCGPGNGVGASAQSSLLGYTEAQIASVPEGANMGLGCGNPAAIASLRAGETVLDLGSGGGFDCFLAASMVGVDGRVIGVDMTAEMVSRARANAVKGSYDNVEFRLGEIEHLPVADATVDAIISNCVINLSPEKERVFGEAYRVLRPGGRLAISDVVATAELPAEAQQDLALYTACVAGAASIATLEALLRRVGFTRIEIRPKDESREFIREWAPGRGIEEYVVSAPIEAVKPDA